MKIPCPCGELVVDPTDDLPHKAHIVPDQAWSRLLEAVDEAVEASGPSPEEKEAACMRVRSLLGEISRLAFQCGACGRLFVADPRHALRVFAPEGDDVPREIFRSRGGARAP